MQINVQKKVITLTSSIGLLILLLFVYNLDKSMKWNAEKTISFILIGTYTFFIIPSIWYYLFINKNNSNIEWLKKGFVFGASKIILPLFLAPIYGIKFYMLKKQ